MSAINTDKIGNTTSQTIPRMPIAERGMRIGLLGGSFNPPHEGHRHISLVALQRLKLDRIWWIVTPGNPLKPHSELADLNERMKWCKKCSDHPRIDVTDFEETRRSSFTYETLKYIKNRYPATRFTWLMGADNLVNFHHWRMWQKITELVPIAVIDRPGFRLRANASRFAHFYRFSFINESKCSNLSSLQPPKWTLITARLHPISSTEIRKTAEKT